MKILLTAINTVYLFVTTSLLSPFIRIDRVRDFRLAIIRRIRRQHAY